MYWVDLIKYCENCNSSIKDSFKSILYEEDYFHTSLFFDFLLGGITLKESSSFTGVSRQKVAQWMNGKDNASVEEVFFIFLKKDILSHFLIPLIGKEMTAEVFSKYQIKEKQDDALSMNPLLSFICVLIDAPPYRDLSGHEDGVLGGVLHITDEKEKEYLKLLEERSLIELVNEKYVNKLGNKELPYNTQDSIELVKHAFSHGLENIENCLKNEGFAFALNGCVATNTKKKIINESKKFYSNM